MSIIDQILKCWNDRSCQVSVTAWHVILFWPNEDYCAIKRQHTYIRPENCITDIFMRMIACLFTKSISLSCLDLFWCWYWKVRRWSSGIRKSVIFYLLSSLYLSTSETKDEKTTTIVVIVSELKKVENKTRLTSDFFGI